MRTSNRLHRLSVAALVLVAAATVQAHDYKAGDVRIGHPFATPSLPGAPHGAAYIATLETTGAGPDKLVRASTPAAARVELHTMALDAGVMRMREVGEIVVEPKSVIRMRPGQGFHLMLMQLKQPLKVGDTFPLVLEFERGGRTEVRVEVQQPRERAAGHKH